VNATPVNGDQITIKTAKGNEKSVKTQVPAYFRDYATLRWSGSDNLLVPAAVGGILLKEVMWSQDFLGACTWPRPMKRWKPRPPPWIRTASTS
jgi:hypothetical protein